MHRIFPSKNLCIYLSVVLVLFFSCTSDQKKDYTKIQPHAAATTSSFVGSETCKACHQDAFDNWKGSHHDNAMQIANELTVLGDFNDVNFSHKNIRASFFKKDNEFYVHTEGPNGVYDDFKIEYTFGVTPLQQYLIRFDNGEFQCLTTAWDTEKNEWFSLLQPDIDIVHGDWLHWTGGAMSWNTMCADCHSTDLRKNFEASNNTYSTTFSEINVSCEACHGPASAHVNFYEGPSTDAHPPRMYMDSTLTSVELVDKCARCHSRRSQITPYFDYSGGFLDHYAPSALQNGLYHVDGQIDDEVYVYGSFIQSKMYHNGVSCKDCHNVHSLELKDQGNNLCLNCHTSDYNEPSHHFHSMNSEGAQCISCHMTGKMYMGNDFRRDHSFRVPRPDQSVAYGTPNACTACHTDKSDEWAAQVVVENYGEVRADHFSDYLLEGYYNDISAFEILMRNTAYPDIARATAVNYFGNQYLDNRQLSVLTSYLKDSSALVRVETVAALERMQFPNAATLIEPLLKDTARVVRIAAASYLNMTQENPSNFNGFGSANDEFLTTLKMNADFASGQHQLGLYYQAIGAVPQAMAAYEKAIEIDGYYNRSRMNLALLYYQQGKVVDSERLYLKVIEQEPDFGYAHYMLGLLYNETGNNAKSLSYLRLATEKDPPLSNAFYNYAIKLQEQKDYSSSLTVLQRGLGFFPNEERLVYVKLIAEMNTSQFGAAKETCALLLQIAPNNQEYQQLFRQLSQ